MSSPCSISSSRCSQLAGQLGRGQRVLAEQADHLDALLGGVQRAALALDVADRDQPLDDRRARRGRADAGVLHRLAQLGVLDVLAGGLHRAEQRGLGEAPRRLGLLAERLDRRASRRPRPARAAGRSWSPPESSSSPGCLRLLAVDAPSSRPRSGRGRWCGRRARRPWSRRACARRRRRGGRWPGSAWRRGRRSCSRPAPIFDRSCSDRVGMIAWWSSTFLSLTTRPSGSFSSAVTYAAPFAYALVAPDELGGGLDLGDHVARQEARVRARVGDRLVLLVELLRRGERAPRARSRRACSRGAGAR